MINLQLQERTPAVKRSDGMPTPARRYIEMRLERFALQEASGALRPAVLMTLDEAQALVEQLSTLIKRA